MTRYIRLGVAIAAALTALILLLRPSLWEATPIPVTVGTTLHLMHLAAERGAFMSKLIGASPAEDLPVPVVGVSRAKVSDTFGDPRGADRLHEGADIFAARGTYIVSATPGIVLRIGTNGLGGNVVSILGPGREVYYYAHMDSIDSELQEGQVVGTTTILGRVGTTGNAAGTPPHLHLGIYGDGKAQNPYPRFQTGIDGMSNM